MSGQKYRSFINAFVRSSGDARYLEVGSWAGSTATAALFQAKAKALCIDNWSLFGGPRSQFFSNIETVLTPNIDFEFLEKDFRSVDYTAIGKFNIYLFDGPHEYSDQYDGVMLAQPALDNRHLLIVDDWNWVQVRAGTLQALKETGCAVESSIEVHTPLDSDGNPALGGKKSDWHNGYFMGVICRVPKKRHAA
jgi:hypothetical protein